MYETARPLCISCPCPRLFFSRSRAEFTPHLNSSPHQNLVKQLFSEASLNNKIPTVAEVNAWGGALTHGEILILFKEGEMHIKEEKTKNEQVNFEEGTFESLLKWIAFHW